MSRKKDVNGPLYCDIEPLLPDNVNIYYDVDGERCCWTDKIMPEDLEYEDLRDRQVVSISPDLEYWDDWHDEYGCEAVLVVELK